jgi:hypothetical protein
MFSALHFRSHFKGGQLGVLEMEKLRTNWANWTNWEVIASPALAFLFSLFFFFCEGAAVCDIRLISSYVDTHL